MKQPNLITRLIEKYKEHNSIKAKYNSDDLYIGEIVMLHKITYKQDDSNKIKRYNRTTPIKRFAIFFQKDTSNYIHIKTGKHLKRIEDSAECEFAIDSLCPLNVMLINPLRNQNSTIKLSKKQICDMETEQNKRCGIIPNAEHLFGA